MLPLPSLLALAALTRLVLPYQVAPHHHVISRRMYGMLCVMYLFVSVVLPLLFTLHPPLSHFMVAYGMRLRAGGWWLEADVAVDGARWPVDGGWRLVAGGQFLVPAAGCRWMVAGGGVRGMVSTGCGHLSHLNSPLAQPLLAARPATLPLLLCLLSAV